MFSIILVFLVVIGFIYNLYCIYSIECFFENKNKIFEVNYSPAISIIKPLCGVEENTRDCLISFILQNYSCYEIIFCVRDKNDPVVDLINNLIVEYKDINLRLVIDDRLWGYNYKVSNLINGFDYCQYDFILIADSDIEVKKDYLSKIIQSFEDKNTGVVTCLYQSTGEDFTSILDSLNIIGNFMPSVMTGAKIGGINYAFGSSILIRRDVLLEIGGLKTIVNSLADDYLLGYLPTKLGYKTILSNYIVEHHTDKENWQDYLNRQTRWNRCIKSQRFISYLSLLLTQNTVISLFLWLTNISSMFYIVLFIISLFSKIFIVYLIGIKKLNNPTVKNNLKLILVVEILRFYLWFISLFGNKVNWRNNQFRLNKQGELTQ